MKRLDILEDHFLWLTFFIPQIILDPGNGDMNMVTIGNGYMNMLIIGGLFRILTILNIYLWSKAYSYIYLVNLAQCSEAMVFNAISMLRQQQLREVVQNALSKTTNNQQTTEIHHGKAKTDSQLRTNCIIIFRVYYIILASTCLALSHFNILH